MNPICQVQIFSLRRPLRTARNPQSAPGNVCCGACRICRWSWEPATGPPGGSSPLWSSEARGGDRGGHASEKQSTQRARVFGREVANCALIIVRRAEGACVHTEQDSPLRVGPRSAGPRQAPSAGWLRSFPFFIRDICSVLVPPVIPYPSQLCRPPALRWCTECP